MAIAPQKITPMLWFDTQAEEAAQFYMSIFPNSKIVTTTRYGDFMPDSAGEIMTVEFQLDSHTFVALNGGPQFKFNESISFMINCETQKEIDYYWEKLVAGGGEHSQCGWLKDKFGVSWQVVPALFWKITLAGDAERLNRLMRAVMQMQKFDIAELQRAADAP